MIGSFISGSFIGLMGVKAFVAMGPGLAGMAMFVDAENNMNIVWAFAGFGIAVVASFLATLFLYKDEAPAEVKAAEADAAAAAAADDDTVNPGAVVSPMLGTAVALEDVKDEVFSSGALGQGAAVCPVKGELYAPVDGEVIMLPDTKHAVAIKAISGAEVLMHIGMDTVELKGKGFDPKVKVGDKVQVGQLLIKFDIDTIKAAGYDVTTPVVITNADEIEVKAYANGDVKPGDLLLKWE